MENEYKISSNEDLKIRTEQHGDITLFLPPSRRFIVHKETGLPIYLFLNNKLGYDTFELEGKRIGIWGLHPSDKSIKDLRYPCAGISIVDPKTKSPEIYYILLDLREEDKGPHFNIKDKTGEIDIDKITSSSQFFKKYIPLINEHPLVLRKGEGNYSIITNEDIRQQLLSILNQ